MKNIKLSNNKGVREYREMYSERDINGQFEYINDVYSKPSIYKRNAEQEILARMFDRSGYGYTVLTHSVQFFTCAYVFPHPETGELILCIETPAHTRYTLY